MSDVGTYGNEFFNLSFAKALELMPERMCDYRVVVMLMDRSHQCDSIDDAVDEAQHEDKNSKTKRTNSAIGARLVALVKTLHGGAEIVSMDEGGEDAIGTGKFVDDISNSIVYCNTVKRSRWVKDTLNINEVSEWGYKQAKREKDRAGRPSDLEKKLIKAGHLDASSRSFTRFAELESLRTARKKKVRKVISNVGVLSEGIDVPALDSICFLEDRKSEIDIVQAVGRIMRRPSKDSDKKYGYIIIPVMVDLQRDLFEQISSREDGWRILGQVLRALRSHDPRIETDLHERITIHPPPDPPKPNGNGKGSGEKPPGNGQKFPISFIDKLRAGFYNNVIPSIVASSGMNQEPEEVANLIEVAVHRAGEYFKQDNLESQLEEILDMRGHDKAASKSTDACTVAALILCNAMLMHERIVQSNNSQFENIAGVEEVRAHKTPEKLLVREWKRILEHDYEPVFRQPLNLLERIHYTGRVSSGVRVALNVLAENAVDTAERYAKMGMDHAGPLFQRVMKNKASDGAFFTLPVAATLVAELVLDSVAPPDDSRWCRPEIWESDAILDPACGSGTLLMAILTAVKRRAENLGASDQHISLIHKTMVESSLTGLDINPQSLQIAACQQTIGDTSVSYQEMGLWKMPHGAQGNADATVVGTNDVALGSLELLVDGLERKHQLDLGIERNTFFEKNLAKTKLSGIPSSTVEERLRNRLKRTRIAIFNPPYTNSTGRSDKFTEPVKKAMQRREAWIKDHAVKVFTEQIDVISSSSASTFFTPLINAVLDGNYGVVGKVMPTIACTTASGVNERKFFARQFHISNIVTLHGYGEPNWSTETDINESIMILTRDVDRDLPTTFVALRKRPSNQDEAVELAERIRSGDVGDWGKSMNWPRKYMLNGDWSPGIWFHMELAEVARLIRERSSKLFVNKGSWKQLYELADAYSTGPSLRQKRKWRISVDGEKPDIAVCKSKGESIHKCLLSNPETGYVAVNPNSKKRDIELMSNKYSRLLITEGQATDSGRLSAIAVSTPAVGGGWVPVSNVDEQTVKAWVVYLNSTLGRISILSLRRKKLNFGQYAVGDLKQLIVPVSKKREQVLPLLEAFEETKSMEVNQFRDGDCPARLKWDEAVSEVTGVSLNKLNKWRQLLNSEPSVLGNKAKDLVNN